MRPPNILVSEDLRCKIADFGISDNVGYREMEHKELYTALVPPECRRFNAQFGKEGDVYVTFFFFNHFFVLKESKTLIVLWLVVSRTCVVEETR